MHYMCAMLFRRRKPARLSEKLRELVWPRKGFMRSFRYFRMRLLRLSASPHSIATGFACGIALSWTPFLGFHLVLAIVVAYLLAGNLVAAALGTTVSNPATFPVISALTWETGKWLLGTNGEKSHIDLAALFESLDFAQLWEPVLKPMLVGAIPFAAISSTLLYGLAFLAVRSFQRRRHLRLLERARNQLRYPDEISNV